MILVLAWIVCFRRAIVAGIAVGLVLSALLVTEGNTVAGSAVGASEVAGASTSYALDAVSVGNPTNVETLARTTTQDRGTSGQHVPDASVLRAILVPRAAPLTVVRDADDVELAVIEAAREFQIDAAVFLCVARAESGLRANAIGLAGERGMMQFMPRTWGYYERGPDHVARWTGNSADLGYGEQDVWLPIPSARTAASMWAKGQQGAWSTWKGCAK